MSKKKEDFKGLFGKKELSEIYTEVSEQEVNKSELFKDDDEKISIYEALKMINATITDKERKIISDLYDKSIKGEL